VTGDTGLSFLSSIEIFYNEITGLQRFFFSDRIKKKNNKSTKTRHEKRKKTNVGEK